MSYQEGNDSTVLGEIGQFLCQHICISNLFDCWRTPFKVCTLVGRYRCKWLAGTAHGKHDDCKEHLPVWAFYMAPSSSASGTFLRQQAGTKTRSALRFLILSFSNTVDTGTVNHKTGVSPYSWVRTLLHWFAFNLWRVAYACLRLQSVLCHVAWERL